MSFPNFTKNFLTLQVCRKLSPGLVQFDLSRLCAHLGTSCSMATCIKPANPQLARKSATVSDCCCVSILYYTLYRLYKVSLKISVQGIHIEFLCKLKDRFISSRQHGHVFEEDLFLYLDCYVINSYFFKNACNLERKMN